MLTKQIKGNTYVFYASIKEMPIKLHNSVGRYLLQDMGIGCDMQAIDDRFAQLDSYLSAGKTEEALQERENQRFAFYTMIQGVSFKSLAFGCHLYSVNGELVKDYSEEHLQELTDELSVSMEDVEAILNELKKNFELN
jgi:hypothetical protein